MEKGNIDLGVYLKLETQYHHHQRMITFKILGAKYEIPTRWEDVTFNQLTEYLKCDHSLNAHISIFTGISRETLAKAELKNLERIAAALEFLYIQFEPKSKPTPMVGPYTLPKDVTVQSVGQFEDLRGMLSEMPKDFKVLSVEDHLKVNELYLKACAIYVQKIADGTYDYSQVPKYMDQLRNYSCIEVVQTGAFFLFKPLNISTSIKIHYQNIIQRLRRLLQDWPGYQKSLDFLLRSSKQVKE